MQKKIRIRYINNQNILDLFDILICTVHYIRKVKHKYKHKPVYNQIFTFRKSSKYVYGLISFKSKNFNIQKSEDLIFKNFEQEKYQICTSRTFKIYVYH